MARRKSSERLAGGYICHFEPEPEPEGGYTVTCPKLPALVTFGETLEEARTNAQQAIELCLEVFEEQGQPIPRFDPEARIPVDELVAVKRTAG